MSGFLHRTRERGAPAANAGVKGGRIDVSSHAFTPSITLPEGDTLPEPDHETFIFSLGFGMPLVASTPERLVTFLACHNLDTTLHLFLPPDARREITHGERGYYCRILVPVPNDLPDRIAVM